MNRTPFAHQNEAVDRLREALRAGKRRVMLTAPTGFGKTLLAVMIAESALARGKRVMVTVPAISLVDQTVTALTNEGIDAVGVIQATHELSDLRQPVQVASIQTLSRRAVRRADGKLFVPQADVVLVDEAHLWFAFYERWFSDPAWLDVPIIGLSATPWTKGLGKHFQELISVRTTAELIEQKFLSPFRVFAPSHPDLKGVRTQGGDYHEGDLANAMNKPALVADVVSTWLERGEDRPTLCFGVDRAHAKALQRQFEHAGVSAGYINYATDLEERKEIGRQFYAGEIKVVCNVATLTTGVDWDVRAIILARPTKSRMLFVQIVGRGLRTAPGKTDLLLLDHSDTTLRLGFVTDIRQDFLDDGKGRGPVEVKAKPEALPKECPSCNFLKPAKVSVCPSCGFKPAKQSTIECEDGELVELTGKAGASAKADRETKQRWFSMLTHYARENGYASGWIKHTYREKFGVWPVDFTHIPLPPDPVVTGWLKSRKIRFAKGRASSGKAVQSSRRQRVAAMSSMFSHGR